MYFVALLSVKKIVESSDPFWIICEDDVILQSCVKSSDTERFSQRTLLWLVHDSDEVTP